MSVVQVGDFTVRQYTDFRDNSGQFKKRITEGCEDAADALASTGMVYAMAEVATNFKQRSGMLMASLDYQTRGPFGWFFADGGLAPHAAPLEKGASSHDIPNSFGRGEDFGFAEHRKNWAAGGAFFHPGNPAFGFMAAAGRKLAAVGGAIAAEHLPKGG